MITNITSKSLNKNLSESREITLRTEDAQHNMSQVTNVDHTSQPEISEAPYLGSEVSPYPASLMQAYHALTDKKLRRTVTPAERIHLQELRNQIAAIDEKRNRPDMWDMQAEKLRKELVQLRIEVEALPDAASNSR